MDTPDYKDLERTVRLGERYFAKRRAFFDNCHRVSLTIVGIASSAAATSALSEDGQLTSILAITAAVAAATDIAFGFSERARRADDLCRRYARLILDMASVRQVTDDHLKRWQKRRLAIQLEEPSIIAALTAQCQNDQLQTEGYGREHFKHIHWWQKLLIHIVNLQTDYQETVADHETNSRTGGLIAWVGRRFRTAKPEK